MTYLLHTTTVDETRELNYGEEVDEIEDWLLKDDDTPDFGAIYRLVQREYGRCQSSVYVDTTDGRTVRVGWYFVKRVQYDRSEDTFLQGTWVQVSRVVEEARPRVVEAVAV